MNPIHERTTSLSFLCASLVIATLSLSIVGVFSAEPVAASGASFTVADNDPAPSVLAPSSASASTTVPVEAAVVPSTTVPVEAAVVPSTTVPVEATEDLAITMAAPIDRHDHDHGDSVPEAAATSEPQRPTERALSVPEPAGEILSCTIQIAVEPSLRSPAATALATLNAELVNVNLELSNSGVVTIRFGGEWPADVGALGWTDPSKRSILINPNHPGSTMEPALAEVIAHELGHVLISPAHVNDGTILDPNLDGQIRIGEADRSALATLTCDALGSERRALSTSPLKGLVVELAQRGGRRSENRDLVIRANLGYLTSVDLDGFREHGLIGWHRERFDKLIEQGRAGLRRGHRH